MTQFRGFEGFEEVDRMLATLPQITAKEISGTLFRQALEGKRAIAERSRMGPSGKRAIRARKGIVQIDGGPKEPRRLQDVRVDVFSTWKGDSIPTVQEATARAIEPEVGKSEYRPKRARGLLVPVGPKFRTPTGRIKRRGGKKLNPADDPNARFVTSGRGRVLLVRDVPGRRARSEVIGVLLPRARIRTSLDFFGSWASLARRRTGQYGQTLDRVIRRSSRGRGRR